MRRIDEIRERPTMSEYTPTMDEIKRWYSGAVGEYRCDTGMSEEEGEAAFDRAIAAHDKAIRRKWTQEATEDVIIHDEALEKALRERIARKIEVDMRRHDNAQIGFSAVGDAYAHAARIAREEGQ